MTSEVFEAPPGTAEAERERRELSPVLKFFLEMGPLAIFFVANARAGVFWATALFMVAVIIALAISYAMIRRLPLVPLVSAIIVVAFGALTLVLHDETFIKVKTTILNVIFGTVLLGGLFFNKSLLGYAFDSFFRLTDRGWRTLTFRWGLYFFFLALVNEIVWRNFSTDFWVGFKVFGFTPISVIFTLSQLPLIMRETIKDEAEAPAKP